MSLGHWTSKSQASPFYSAPLRTSTVPSLLLTKLQYVHLSHQHPTTHEQDIELLKLLCLSQRPTLSMHVLSCMYKAWLQKLILKLSFYFRNKLCFSFNVRKRLIAATFLPVLYYGDLMYMRAPAQALKLIDTVYHASLRFIRARAVKQRRPYCI